MAIALVTVWAGIAISYQSDWPLGFFVGVIGAVFFLLGRAYAAVALTENAFLAGRRVVTIPSTFICAVSSGQSH